MPRSQPMVSDVFPTSSPVNRCGEEGTDVASGLDDVVPGLVEEYADMTGDVTANVTHNVAAPADVGSEAFNNSTRKTLSFIAPTLQNGEVIMRPTLDIIRNSLLEVTETANGFFFFQFKSVIAMEDVIEGGLGLFQGQPIVLQKGAGNGNEEAETYTGSCLDQIAPLADGIVDEVGKPLYPDAITRACMRLNFARICVILDVTSKLPKHIIIMTPDEDGGESPCKIDVEYEWLSPKCTICMTLGHSAKECALNRATKLRKPPVAVYVLKVRAPKIMVLEQSRAAPAAHRREEHMVVRHTPIIDEVPCRDERDTDPPTWELMDWDTTMAGPGHADRCKALVIYNSFDALHLLDNTNGSLRGPKECSPTCLNPC
ncbi:UNVERIFIED_CONTAM: hypothetical protein Sindi_1822500 [Sesamum indicum]